MIRYFRCKRHFATTHIMLFCVSGLLLTVPMVDAQQHALDTNIVDLPNGKTQLDGQFSLGLKETWEAKKHYLSYQAVPWLYLGFSYNQYQDQDYNDYQYDVGFDVYKQKHTPLSVKIGMQDLLDTASHRTAYISSTYQAGQVDLSLGLQNSQKQNRLFAGFSYTIPEWRSQLSLQLADPIDYDNKVIAPSWQVNWKWFFSTNWMVNLSHSSEHNIGLGLQWHFDTKAPLALNIASSPISDDPIIGISSGHAGKELTKKEQVKYLINRFSDEGIFITAIDMAPDCITVLIDQKRFADASFAVNLIHPYVKQLAAQSIKRVEYIVEEQNVTIYKIVKPVSSVNTTSFSSVAVMSSQTVKPVLMQDLQRMQSSWVRPPPHLKLAIDNRLWLPQQHSQGQKRINNKLEAQVFFELQGEWQWHPNSLIEIVYEVDLWDQIAVPRQPNAIPDYSLVPLRTARYESFQNNEHRLSRLVLKTFNQKNHQQHDASRVFSYSAALGRLTHNLKGLSVDMSYQKWDSRYAFGVNLVAVRPAGRLQHLVPDNTYIHSSLVSASWYSPFYNLQLSGLAGRFLGGDKGVKLAISRHFSNGWQVGFWQTTSSLAGQHFLDRGFRLSIPIGGIFKTPTTSSIKSRLRAASGNSGMTLIEETGDVGLPLHIMQSNVFGQ